MKKALLFFSCFLLFCQLAKSQQYVNASYGTDKNEIAQKLLVQNDSTILLMGSSGSHAFVLYKIKTDGDTIFTKRLNMPFFTLGTDMIACPNGDVVLIGFYGGLAKIDQHGTLLWTINNDDIDQWAGALINDTTFAVAGSKPIFSHMQMIPDLGMDSIFVPKVHVALYHTSGKILKEQVYTLGTDDMESATDILLSLNGNLQVNGYAYMPSGYPNVFLLTLAPDLTKLQDSVLTHSGIYVSNDMIENTRGNYVSCGSKYNNTARDFDSFIQERNAAGGIIWEKILDVKGNAGSDALIESDGFYYVAGGIESNSNSSQKSADVLLLKLDSQGDTIWTKTYTLPDVQFGVDIRELNDSMLVLLGVTYFNTTCYDPSPNAQCADLYVMYIHKKTGYSKMYPDAPQPLATKNEVLVYPNPARNKVNVQAKGVKSVLVRNAIGKEIQANQRVVSDQELEISGLGKGIYFLLIETETGFENKRVVIM